MATKLKDRYHMIPMPDEKFELFLSALVGCRGTCVDVEEYSAMSSIAEGVKPIMVKIDKENDVGLCLGNFERSPDFNDLDIYFTSYLMDSRSDGLLFVKGSYLDVSVSYDNKCISYVLSLEQSDKIVRTCKTANEAIAL